MSDLGGFRRKGHRSFRIFGPRGWAPSETPCRAAGTIHFLAPDFGACRLAVEECVDTGVSGAKSDRQASNQLMEAARLRRFATLSTD